MWTWHDYLWVLVAAASAATVAAAQAANAADPVVLVALVGGIAGTVVAWLNSRVTRNSAAVDALGRDVERSTDRAIEADNRADEAERRALEQIQTCTIVRNDLYRTQVELAECEIGAIRLVRQLEDAGIEPVWRPDSTAPPGVG